MKRLQTKIVLITFLNDFSGSPNILSVIANGLVRKGYQVEIITNHGIGFLTNIKGAKYKYVTYMRSNNNYLTLLFFIIAQIQLFIRIIFYKNDNTIFYINTITPIGAAWACKLTAKKRIYHVHENMQQDKPLYWLFRTTYKCCNTKTIFVSHYLEKLAVGTRSGKVIYNSLENEFTEIAQKYLNLKQKKGKYILIVASLRRFKGVYEFVELARKLPNYNFEMVLNATEQEVKDFRIETSAPDNVTLHSVQQNLHPFYQQAKILLNLSHPNLWVETFGLTILEAMVYGIPAIGPPIGGPTEIIEDGINGYIIDPKDLNELTKKITILMTDDEKYNTFSYNAYNKSKIFNYYEMINNVENYILK